MSNDTTPLQFNFPRDTRKIIKVVGVGGGGGNAVTHMFKEGIHDVSFVLCNTDSQALSRSDVPVKIALGRTVTEGLGAGNNPARAERAAEESEDDIRTMLDDGTKMVFITAGMGGGTGTGAAPEIARVAKEMGLLTVGIVTIPFLFEGPPKIIQALKGVEAISKNVDAITELLRGLVETTRLEGVLTFTQVRKRINSVLWSSWAGQCIPVIGIGPLEHGDDRADSPNRVLTPKVQRKHRDGKCRTDWSKHVAIRGHTNCALWEFTDYRSIFLGRKFDSELPEGLEVEDVVVVSEILQ